VPGFNGLTEISTDTDPRRPDEPWREFTTNTVLTSSFCFMGMQATNMGSKPDGWCRPDRAWTSGCVARKAAGPDADLVTRAERWPSSTVPV